MGVLWSREQGYVFLSAAIEPGNVDLRGSTTIIHYPPWNSIKMGFAFRVPWVWVFHELKPLWEDIIPF